MVVILVKAMGDSESKSNESIIRAICDKLVGGVAELQNKSCLINSNSTWLHFSSLAPLPLPTKVIYMAYQLATTKTTIKNTHSVSGLNVWTWFLQCCLALSRTHTHKHTFR